MGIRAPHHYDATDLYLRLHSTTCEFVRFSSIPLYRQRKRYRVLRKYDGRWMSPDWSSSPTPVPYSNLHNPQSLNLYGYVNDNPLSRTDIGGHFWRELWNALVTGCGCWTKSRDTANLKAYINEQAMRGSIIMFLSKCAEFLCGDGSEYWPRLARSGGPWSSCLGPDDASAGDSRKERSAGSTTQSSLGMQS
jgi:hypothetical protein